ncbi:E3 ubiquitin-protein ligase TRIM13 [Platysternon megacephalum]|uniref:E3 ubiquitin-protein ligase TRIM13 n=1 Tax=Platysternon megacephalum TaxID=55544 RepID=A0A4D9ER98_9SAUR|nr:E3 ubiquitin-protein ligase TRIM13 [Platysternon megacephalum]
MKAVRSHSSSSRLMVERALWAATSQHHPTLPCPSPFLSVIISTSSQCRENKHLAAGRTRWDMREGGTRRAYRETFQCGETGEGVDCRAEKKRSPVLRTETHLAAHAGNCSPESNGEGLSKASALKGSLP